jgi:hypothetical protein
MLALFYLSLHQGLKFDGVQIEMKRFEVKLFNSRFNES